MSDGAPLRPPQAYIFHNRVDDKNSPRYQREQGHRGVVPDWLGVVIKIGSEARKIMLQDKDAEEIRIANLDGYVPWQSNDTEKNDAGNPESMPERLHVPREQTEDDENRSR